MYTLLHIYTLCIIIHDYIAPQQYCCMAITFVTKLAKSGSDSNGKERRIFIIPSDRVKEITKKCEGKQVKITIEEI